MAADAGLSMADLRARSNAGKLRAKEVADDDPIAHALRVDEQLTARAIMRRSAGLAEAEAVKAENERRKAELESRELERLAEQSTGVDAFQQHLIDEVAKLRDELGTTQRFITEQQQARLEEKVAELEAEIRRAGETKDESALVLARRQVEEAKALIEILTPTSLAPPPSSDDPAFQAWRYRAEHQAELDRRRLDMEQEERRAERERALARQEAELDLERQKLERQERFFTDTLPKIIQVGEQILGKMGQPSGAALSAPMLSAVPPGVIIETCSQCGARLMYREEWSGVICPSCGAEYTFTPDPSPSVEPSSSEGLPAGDEQ